MASFNIAEAAWGDRLGGLRNLVRQDSIARQLEGHVSAQQTVLDVGCGQGTQAIRLAARGCVVAGIDPSVRQLEQLNADAHAAGVQIETLVGSLKDLPALLGEAVFGLDPVSWTPGYAA